jgi:hypothetical protein
MPAEAGIAEPEKMPIDKQWFCKHVSTATESCNCRNRHKHNNRGTVGSGVFYAVGPKAIYREPKWSCSQSTLDKGQAYS